MKQYIKKDIDVFIYVIGLVFIGYSFRCLIWGGSGYILYAVVLFLLLSILIKVINEYK
jgi:hypothetical protein